jgi:hypothetical protein
VGAARLSRPGTRYIVEPVYDHEQLIIADLNLSEIDQEFLTWMYPGITLGPTCSNSTQKQNKFPRKRSFRRRRARRCRLEFGL